MSSMTMDPWSMTRTESAGGGGTYKYELIPADNHPGALVGMFHVGQHAQEETDKATGAKKTVLKHRLVLVYEVSEDRSDGTPHLIAERVTWSLNEKANFLSRAAALLGRDITVGETIDPREMLGRPCMIDVTHTPPKANAKGEMRVYHQLKGVAKMPKGMPPYQCRTPTVAWSVVDDKPFPAGDWPFVYGQSIQAIAEESVEAGARKAARIKAQAEATGRSVSSFDEFGPAPFE